MLETGFDAGCLVFVMLLKFFVSLKNPANVLSRPDSGLVFVVEILDLLAKSSSPIEIEFTHEKKAGGLLPPLSD